MTLAGLLLAPAIAGAQGDPATVYEEAGDAVFRILTPYSEGTGFLVDRAGYVITNAHVLNNVASAHVRVSDSVKVRGRVVDVDTEHDLAVVQIHPSAVTGIDPVRLNSRWRTSAGVGDQVSVLGFPLSQGLVVTSGIIGRLEKGFFFIDANVNPGGSGGPVLDVSGSVIGVATFHLSPESGSGLSGAVGAENIDPLLARARNNLDGSSPPEEDRLPVVPREIFSVQQLQEAAEADEWPVGRYDLSDELITADFVVHLYTPPFLAWLDAGSYRLTEVGEDFKDTEEDDEQVPIQRRLNVSHWSAGTGRYQPVVILRITPRFGVSGARRGLAAILSAFSTAVTGTPMPTPSLPPRFQGSVEGVTVYVGTEGETSPLRVRYLPFAHRGREFHAAYIVLDPADFIPPGCEEYTGGMRVEIQNPLRDQESNIFVPPPTIEQIWSDFHGGETSAEEC